MQLARCSPVGQFVRSILAKADLRRRHQVRIRGDVAENTEESKIRGLRRLLSTTTLLAVSGSLLFLVMAGLWPHPGGLRHSVAWRAEGADFSFTDARADTADLSFLNRGDGAPPTRFRASWAGFIRVHEAGSFVLLLRADDAASVAINGETVAVHEANSSVAWSETVTIALDAGLHPFEVDYRQGLGMPVLDLRLSPVGKPPQRIDPNNLFLDRLEPADLARVDLVRSVRRIVIWLWLLPLTSGLLLLLLDAAAGRARARRWMPALALVTYFILLSRWFTDPGLGGEGGMRSMTHWPLAALLLILVTGCAVAHRARLHALARDWADAMHLNRRDIGLLTVVILVSFLFQLPMMLYPAGVLHSDAAINGLMAMHIGAGHVAPAFYYGQQFMGTLFSHVLAALFVITGPFAAGLTILSWVFFAGFLAAGYLMVRQASGQVVGFIVALWLAMPPIALLVTLPQTEYPQLLLLSSWALALASARLGELLKQEAWWVVVGALLGLAFWGHAFAVFALAAVVGTLPALLPLRTCIRSAGLVAAGFILGVLPGLIGWGSNFGMFLRWFLAGGTRGGEATFSEALEGLISISLGNLLLGTSGEIQVSMWISAPLASTVLASIAWAGWRAWRYRFGRDDSENPGSGSERRCLAVALPLALFLLFHLAPLLGRNAYTFVPRQYLVPLYLGVPALVAIFLHSALRTWSRFATPVTVTVIGLWACIPLPSSIGLLRSLPAMETRMEESLVALRSAGVDHCMGDYWDAYRLSYLSLEEIICESYRVKRVPHYPEAVAQRGMGRASVFVAAPRRASLREREESLRSEGIVFRRIETRELVALVEQH